MDLLHRLLDGHIPFSGLKLQNCFLSRVSREGDISPAGKQGVPSWLRLCRCEAHPFTMRHTFMTGSQNNKGG